MALQVVDEVEELPHPASRRLHALLTELGAMTTDALGGVDDESSEADLVDQVAVLERLRAAVAAVQAATVVRFARARVERQLALDVHPRDVGRGIAEEVGLACRLSPTVAARRLSSARAWWFDLPHTYVALATGELSEQTADAVVTETRHLDGRRGVRWTCDWPTPILLGRACGRPPPWPVGTRTRPTGRPTSPAAGTSGSIAASVCDLHRTR